MARQSTRTLQRSPHLRGHQRRRGDHRGVGQPLARGEAWRASGRDRRRRETVAQRTGKGSFPEARVRNYPADSRAPPVESPPRGREPADQLPVPAVQNEKLQSPDGTAVRAGGGVKNVRHIIYRSKQASRTLLGWASLVAIVASGAG